MLASVIGPEPAGHLLNKLCQDWSSGLLTTADYLARAEGLARFLAGMGEPGEVRRLAALLDLKAREIRAAHGPEADAVAAEAESITLLDQLCDAGDDEAQTLLDAVASASSVAACERARDGRKIKAPPSVTTVRTAPPAPITFTKPAAPVDPLGLAVHLLPALFPALVPAPAPAPEYDWDGELMEFAASAITAHYDLDHETVWNAMLDLDLAHEQATGTAYFADHLKEPNGWTVLGNAIAAKLRLPPTETGLVPTVH